MSDTGESAPTTPPAGSAPPVPPMPAMPPAAPPYATPPQGYPMPQGYPTPPGYPAPQVYPTPRQGYQTSPQGYAPPQGYIAPRGYATPPHGYGPYAPPRPAASNRGAPGLGIVAFVLSMLAAFGASVFGSIAGYNVGVGTGREIVLQPADIDFDWSILTPVREWVLMGEVAFWAGTVLGIWALVQGIIAIAKNRGRGWAIAAVVVAVIGPIAFGAGVQGFLLGGFASGATIGG